MKVGITGGIGSGKSTLCAMLEQMGMPIFYADQEAHAIFKEDDDVRHQVIDLLGEQAYLNGELDRKWVGGIVFNDHQKLESLNAIMHPAMKRRFKDWASKQEADIIGMEAAILIESGGHKDFDHIIVVTAPMDVRVQRVIQRDNITKQQVESRIAAQMSDEKRCAYADIIIENNGGPKALRPKAKRVMKFLRNIL